MQFLYYVLIVFHCYLFQIIPLKPHPLIRKTLAAKFYTGSLYEPDYLQVRLLENISNTKYMYNVSCYF